MERFRGWLLFKAHRLLYHSTLDPREIKKAQKKRLAGHTAGYQAIFDRSCIHRLPVCSYRRWYGSVYVIWFSIFLRSALCGNACRAFVTAVDQSHIERLIIHELS